MHFITCASYYGTGSSAITDFVSEFNNVYSFTDEEFRFVHDPEGISDLEYHLTENFNRHNSGHALKRYKRLVDYYSGNLLLKRYERFFHGNWKKISYEYIDELTDFTYHGWWNYDLIDGGPVFHFQAKVINKILHMTFWRKQRLRTIGRLRKEITYCSHPTKEKFLSCTKRYMEKLFSSVCDDGKIIMVDQLVASTNIDRYLKYFDDIKVVLVDRDPRDIFALEKYIWKSGVIPSEVTTFCKWFEYTRSHRKTENVDTEQIIFIQFEDMIYHYEETEKKLMQRLGLEPEKHDKRKKCFDPDISIQNTQVWKKIKCDLKEIEYIEQHLREYLYPF